MSDVTDAIAAALDRVDLAAVARQLGAGEKSGLDDTATEQFLRAFEALLREALEGGREQRELVMDAAVPALVRNGQTAADLLRSHVEFFVALAPSVVGGVEPAGLRDDAAVWLGGYAAEYTAEVVARAQAIAS
jgi:hypothetical protein